MFTEFCDVKTDISGLPVKTEKRKGFFAALYNSIFVPLTLTAYSFNMHEEPIVNLPSEAILAFQQSDLDPLILGQNLILSQQTDTS